MRGLVSWRLVTLTVLFCTALIVSNVIAGKLISFGPVTLTAAVVLFPVVYIIGDVVPEVYGLAVARRVIWLGFAANLFAVVFWLITVALPHPVFFTGQDAFATVLTFTPRLLAASFVGYLVGTNVNAYVLVRIKQLTGERWLWMRTIGSTIVGEAVDSGLFVVLAFAFVLPWSAVAAMVFWQWAVKTAYEVVATPLTYGVVARVKRAEASTARAMQVA